MHSGRLIEDSLNFVCVRPSVGWLAPLSRTKKRPSTSPKLIRGLLANTGDIVADSAELARSLHRKQKWMSSVGLVMVLRGTVEKEACLIVAKMEHEEGMRVQATTWWMASAPTKPSI